MRRVIMSLLCLLAVLVPALTPVAGRAQTGGFGFGNRPVITLDVAEIEVVNTYVAPLQPPNVEHTLSVTPAESVRLWVQERLKAGGTTGKLRVTIKQASIVEVQLPRTTGIKGWFTTDQTQRYDGTLSVGLQIEQPAKNFLGSTESTVTSSKSVSEDVTLDQRQVTWDVMVHEMARDMDSQLSQGIRNNLADVILP